MLIEVDENGTLDLSMKKCKENRKAHTKTPSNEQLPPNESAMVKGGSLLIGPAFYQPLCDRETWENSIPVNFNKVHILQDKEVQSCLWLKNTHRLQWGKKAQICLKET